MMNRYQTTTLNLSKFREDQKEGDLDQLKALQVNYYGLNLPLQYDPSMDFRLLSPFEDGVPDAWEKIAESEHYALISQLNVVAERLRLNDWGYYTLVNQFGERIYPGDYNKQVLFACFMLNKSGYLAKVAFSSSDLFLLLPSRQEVYEVPFLDIKGRRFYVFPANPNVDMNNLSINTYEGDYQNTTRVINFAFREAMNLPKQLQTTKLTFNHDNQSYQFPVTYNKSAIEFYQKMPLVSFDVTLSSPLSDESLASIRKGLAPILRGKTEPEQVNIILRFVQKSFDYQTDQEQFGSEKYFYPEEVLHFPASDCEDRSALFSVLVRELVGLDVIGLIFPKHVATAVLFNEDLEGDYITHNKKKYLICDPTYIGADIGMCMTKFKSAEAKLILFD